MRLMATQLGVSPTTLSDVIAGKKHLSDDKASSVAEKLKLNAREARYFRLLVQFQSSKTVETRTDVAAQLRTLNPKLRSDFEIPVDRFTLIADWYHTAILEMTYLERTKLHPQTIAIELGILEEQATEAIELLLRLDLIEALGNGSYRKTNKKFLIQSPTPNEALRQYHSTMLELAKKSLTTQTPKEKSVGSETIPLSSDDLAEANEIIETCFQQIIQLSERSKNKDQVYHLGIQLFRLTGQGKK